MDSIGYFRDIARERENLEKVGERIALLESRIQPHGQGFEPMGTGGGSDKMFSLLLARIQLTELQDLERKMPHMRARLNERIEQALQVLYGKDGGRGLAKARSSTDADILCCHYLQGMSWADIAREVVKPETDYPVQWVRQRAMRACAYIDKVGMSRLVNW